MFNPVPVKLPPRYSFPILYTLITRFFWAKNKLKSRDNFIVITKNASIYINTGLPFYISISVMLLSTTGIFVFLETNFIPHLGYFPGLLFTTLLSIGQVYFFCIILLLLLEVTDFIWANVTVVTANKKLQQALSFSCYNYFRKRIGLK